MVSIRALKRFNSFSNSKIINKLILIININKLINCWQSHSADRDKKAASPYEWTKGANWVELQLGSCETESTDTRWAELRTVSNKQ